MCVCVCVCLLAGSLVFAQRAQVCVHTRIFTMCVFTVWGNLSSDLTAACRALWMRRSLLPASSKTSRDVQKCCRSVPSEPQWERQLKIGKQNEFMCVCTYLCSWDSLLSWGAGFSLGSLYITDKQDVSAPPRSMSWHAFLWHECECNTTKCSSCEELSYHVSFGTVWTINTSNSLQKSMVRN